MEVLGLIHTLELRNLFSCSLVHCQTEHHHEENRQLTLTCYTSMDLNAVVNIPVARKFKCHKASAVKSKCVLGLL